MNSAFSLLMFAVLVGLIASGVGLITTDFRRARWRRIANGCLLVLVALSGGWIAVGGGWSTVALSRAWIVVVAADIDPDGLRTLLRELPSDERVSFVVLSDAIYAPPDSPRWTTVSQLTDAPGRLETQLATSPAVVWTDPGWLREVTTRCQEVVRSPSCVRRFFSSPTVLIVTDGNEKFRRLPTREQDYIALAAELRARYVEAFVSALGSKPVGGRMSIRFGQSTLDAGRLADRDYRFGVDFDPAGRADGRELPLTRLELAIDREPMRTLPEAKFFRRDADERAFHLDVRGGLPLLSSAIAEDPAFELKPGFHKLTVRATVPSADSGRGEVFEDSAFFEVAARQLAIGYRADGGKLGGLADAGWRRAFDEPPHSLSRLLIGEGAKKGLLSAMQIDHSGRVRGEGPWSILPSDKHFVALPTLAAKGYAAGLRTGRADRQQIDRPGLKPDAVEAARLVAAGKWLALLDGKGDVGGRPTALMLVEPELAQLGYLEGFLEMGRRTEDGLNVAVIGPPTALPGAEFPPWLHYGSEPISPPKRDRPLEVHRDRRVYFVIDHSRASLISPVKDLAGTKYDYPAILAQKHAIDEIYSRLGATPASRLIANPNPPKGEDDYYPRLLLGPNRHAKGKADITLYPPISLTYTEDRGPNRYKKGLADESVSDDWKLSHVGLRLQAILSTDRKPTTAEKTFPDGSFEPMHYPDLYPNTSVVLFVVSQPKLGPDLPNNTWTVPAMSGAMIDKPVPIPHTFDPAMAHRIDELRKMGVRVFVVELDFAYEVRKWIIEYQPALLPQSGKGSFDSRLKPDPNENLTERISIDSKDPRTDIEAKVREIARNIADRISAETPVPMTRPQTGRDIDERTWPRRDAKDAIAEPPEHHRRLVRQPPPPKSPPMTWQNHAKTDDATLMVSAPLGEGRVVVFGYSPFARDVWENDSGTSVWPYDAASGDVDEARKNRLRGSGLQRLLDLAGLSSTGTPAADRTAIREVIADRTAIREVIAYRDGSTLEIVCSVDPLQTKRLRVAVGAKSFPMDLVDLDPASRLGRYRLSAPADWPAGETEVRVELIDPANAGVPLGRVFVQLSPGSVGGRDLADLLDKFARASDGATVPGGVSTIPPSRRSVATFAGLFLVGAMLLLLTHRVPTGLRRARRWWLARARQPISAEGLQTVGRLDLPTLAAQWGEHSGPPRSGRQSGTPGGERFYRSGDPLGSARLSTMVALTDLGLELELPPGLPKIRLRHLGAAIEATLLIDLSPAMRYPEPGTAGTDKTTFVREMTLALAEWLWGKGGMVRLGDLANPADLSEPMGAGSGHELDDHLRALFAAPRAIANPAGIDSATVGSVCFALVSQLVEVAPLESVLRALSPDGVSVRILALCDPREIDCTGLTRNRSDGSWQDRTEWDAEDVRVGYRNRVVALERLALKFDGRFVALATDLNEGDITEAFKRSNFLE